MKCSRKWSYINFKDRAKPTNIKKTCNSFAVAIDQHYRLLCINHLKAFLEKNPHGKFLIIKKISKKLQKYLNKYRGRVDRIERK